MPQTRFVSNDINHCYFSSEIRAHCGLDACPRIIASIRPERSRASSQLGHAIVTKSNPIKPKSTHFANTCTTRSVRRIVDLKFNMTGAFGTDQSVLAIDSEIPYVIVVLLPATRGYQSDCPEAVVSGS